MSGVLRKFSIFEDDEDDIVGAIRVRIISTSDVYDLGNWPRVHTALAELKLPDEEGNYNILLLPGDFLAPSVISCVDGGASMVDCMNRIGFQFCTFGNHETDVRMTSLADRIRESKFTWINSNMTGLPDFFPPLPEHVKLDFESSTQRRSIALVGLLTDDPYLYRAGSFGGASIAPVAATALRLHEKLAPLVDCVIPLTHQSMAHDRHLALISSGKFPCIIGAHDHSPFTETVAGVPIIKAGMDAINLAITDIVWSSAMTPGEAPDVSISLVPVKRFEPDATLAKIVKDHQTRVLGTLDAAHIVPLRPVGGLTSLAIRVEQRTMGTFLASILRDSVLGDCCLLPSGTIRRGYEYPADHLMFTYRDLVSELPFDDDVVVVDFPGSVIEEGLKFSRGPLRRGMGGFLQTCSLIEVDGDNNILKINGDAFDPARKYRMVMNILALEGIDDNVPLIRQFNLPKSEGGYEGIGPREGDPRRIPLKLALQTVIARRRVVEIWSERCSADTVKSVSVEGGITREEFIKHPLNDNAPDWFMDQFFQLIDWDNDGKLNLTDIAIAHIHCWLSGPPSGIEVDNIYRIDVSGRTTLDELRGHLGHLFPAQAVGQIMDGICEAQGEKKSAFVSRADILNWLDILKARTIH
jgi:2',3'-cyclic-nucleotide 2'-phosphodiesterase (5'-nucleotidase family)